MSDEMIGFLSLEQKNAMDVSTGPITICHGQGLIDRYKVRVRTEPPTPIPLITTSNLPAEGFYFQMTNDLRNFLASPNVRGVYLAIGEYAQGGHTLILYGVDSNGDTIEFDYKIYDYSEPCPDKCPKIDMISTCN